VTEDDDGLLKGVNGEGTPLVVDGMDLTHIIENEGLHN
jgi:hypothetical protein